MHIGDCMQSVFRENKQKIHFYNHNSIDFPSHIHESIELVYVIKGCGNAFCNGKKYFLSDGSIFLAFPNQVHYYTNFGNDNNVKILIIKSDLLPEHSNTFLNKLLVSSHYKITQNDENLISIFNIAFEEYEKGAKNEIVISILSAFFSILFDKLLLYDIDKNSNDYALKILKYCKQHFKENITLDDISKNLFISKSYISHTLNEKIKISFSDYINSLRVTYSTKLLENTNDSITDIAFFSGFSTIRSFNRAFVKHMGITPLKYRKSLANKYPPT